MARPGPVAACNPWPWAAGGGRMAEQWTVLGEVPVDRVIAPLARLLRSLAAQGPPPAQPVVFDGLGREVPPGRLRVLFRHHGLRDIATGIARIRADLPPLWH